MAKSISTKGSKKKTAPKKKTTGSKTAPISSKSVQHNEKPAGGAVAPEPVVRPLSISELVLKKFDGWNPPHIFVLPADNSLMPDAPPFVSAVIPQEAERISSLLFKSFDLKADYAQYEAERIAAEKAKAERIAAEKAEAERIAAEKAKAERIAAEKAEAERIAAEKAKAERIAAEKAKAERIAAEKAEAERIAVEKAEAARIAAEKAEAERIAVEKAEAERIAAEQRKKAIKAQQAEIPKVTVVYPQQPLQNIEPDPMNNAIKLAAGVFGLLIILLFALSFSNSHNYYVKPVKDGIQIWQGKFSPKGKALLVALPGVPVPKTLHGVCTEKDIYPIIFKYYLDKADIAASKGGPADLKIALGLLNKAKALNTENVQTKQVDEKIAAITTQLQQRTSSVPVAK